MSDTAFSLPSVNPADLQSLEGCLEYLKKLIFQEIEKIIPCRVISYNRETNRAILQPAIYDVATQGQKIQKSPLYDISVFNFGGGGVFMNFPLVEGDTGWIVSSDKDISIFKQNLQISTPNTYLRHRYDQAFFMPDKINVKISNEDDGAFVLRTMADTTKINLKEGAINIKSSSEINTVSNVHNINSTTLNVNSNTNNINGITNITGKTTVTGDTIVNGNTESTTFSTGGNVGISGSFISLDNRAITVINGIITAIN